MKAYPKFMRPFDLVEQGRRQISFGIPDLIYNLLSLWFGVLPGFSANSRLTT